MHIILTLVLVIEGLFQRAIMQSGSALCDWAIERSPLRFARDIAESVGCPSSPSNQLVECLRSITPTALLKAQSKVKVSSPFIIVCSNIYS